MHFLGLWMPVVIWAAVIYWLSSIPYLRIVEAWWDIIIRKIAHAVFFGILARLLTRAWAGSTYWSWKKIFWVSFVMSFLYACSDEFHQSFVPGRSASAIDVTIDTMGAWLALGLKP